MIGKLPQTTVRCSDFLDYPLKLRAYLVGTVIAVSTFFVPTAVIDRDLWMTNTTSQDLSDPSSTIYRYLPMPESSHMLLLHYYIEEQCDSERIASALVPHCTEIDLKVGMWDGVENYEIGDRSRLEYLIEEVLGEMVSQQILRYNEERDLWVLSLGDNRQNLPKIINWVAALGGQLPQHLLLEMSRDEIVRINKVNA